MQKYLRVWTGPAVWCIFGVCAGVIVTMLYFSSAQKEIYNDPTCVSEYPLTSRSLDCGQYDVSSARLRALGSQLEDAVNLYKKEGKAYRVSVWVRDLETKQWAAVNAYETYSPASLLKLPLMIAYYKFSELDPAILNRTIVYQPVPEANDPTFHFTGASTLVAGKSYTVEELIERMMIDSDNGASLTLFANVEPSFYQKTLIELGIQIPNEANSLDYVTVKTYANIFRILYNASYLTRDLSQKALEIMSRSTFSKGIAGGLPPTITVSHKFGERTVIQKDTNTVEKRELHDCGIVYKVPDPYAICIMAEGENFDDLLLIIHSLSEIVYKNT